MVIAFLSFALFVAIMVYLMTYRTKSERSYDEKIAKSLEEEFIIDPETGTKLTLEQAESGHWIPHDNEFKTVPNEEIDKLSTEDEQDAERAINHLRKSKEYLKYQFDEEEIAFLNKTKILSKYNDWSYSNCFRLDYCEGFIFMPAVVIIDRVPGYFDNTYEESQIMCWLKYDHDFGHYYLRDKTDTEKFFDIFKKDDEINLKGFESYTFKKTANFFRLNNIVDKLKGVKNLEIEFIENNLLIKTKKFINLKELIQLETTIKNVC